MNITSIPYGLARSKIHDGDVLLFRRRHRPFSRMIAAVGRSEYSHAAMAAWWNGRLMCLETVQGRGGRAVLLSSLIARFPGAIDVYKSHATRRRFNRQAAVNAMIEITGRRYGWRSLLAAAMRHLPVIRFLVPPDTDDDSNGSLPFCSQAVARACRSGGVDPVPNLPDRLTEPGDLARSALFCYRFTLVLEEVPTDAQQSKRDTQDFPGV